VWMPAIGGPAAISAGLLGAGLAALSTPALATNVVNYPANANISTNLYMSGSSALDGILERSIAASSTGICQTNTLDIYLDDGGVIGSYTTFVAFCSINTLPNQGANKFAAIRKVATGGSGNGVTPLVNGTTLTYLNFAGLAVDPNLATDCPNTAFTTGSTGLEKVAAVTDPNGGATLIPAYNVWHCAANLVSRGISEAVVPSIGWSDAEPSIFTAVSTSSLTINTAVQIVFGIPVNKILRDNLQRAEGLGIGQDDVANMPSLQKTLVAGLFSSSQPVTFWNQLTQTDGTAFHVCSNAADNTTTCSNSGSGANIGLVSGTVFIARRSTTSGTQRTNQLYFLGQDLCLNSAPPGFVAGSTSQTPLNCQNASNNPTINGAGTNRAFQMSDTEDLIGCLTQFNNRNIGALGIASTDYAGQTAGNTNAAIRYVKINGFAPTLLNAAQGLYDLVGQSTSQFVTGNLASPNLDVYNSINVFIGTAAGVRTLDISGNTNNVLVSGNSGSYQGVLALDVSLNGGAAPVPNSPPITEAAIRANPVSGFVRPNTGTALQPSCTPYQINAAPWGLVQPQ